MSSIKELKTSFLFNMIRIRLFEEKVKELYLNGEIPGFLHSYIGQEAIAVGACSAIRKYDYITSTHRGHGHILAKGCDMKKMMAEIFGKKEGYCKGKGGSMHIADFSLGIIGANGIVGGGIPIANGIALAAKMKNKDNVVVCFFGDGAANQGSFHEAINLASIWKLGVIFLCENNLFAMSTPQKEHINIENIADRAAAYGILGLVADGNDVIDVYNKTKKAVSMVRKGAGPCLLECKTYRKLGHYIGDSADYRDKCEKEEWEKKDPIDIYKDKLLKEKIISKNNIDNLYKEAKKEVEESLSFAKSAVFPKGQDACEDLYVGEIYEGLI